MKIIWQENKKNEMIDKKTYEQMKRRWGNAASWAIWRPRNGPAKSNVGNMDWVDDPNLLDTINTQYVFVGLNLATGDGTGIEARPPWTNFHSSYRYAQDYKLRYALTRTLGWGSYITDYIKRFAETNSQVVAKTIKKNKELVALNTKELEEEIALLGGNKILVGMGEKACKLLKENFEGKYKVVGIKHYSCPRIGADSLRNEIIENLEKQSIKDWT